MDGLQPARLYSSTEVESMWADFAIGEENRKAGRVLMTMVSAKDKWRKTRKVINKGRTDAAVAQAQPQMLKMRWREVLGYFEFLEDSYVPRLGLPTAAVRLSDNHHRLGARR